jgi:hypothetical protein
MGALAVGGSILSMLTTLIFVISITGAYAVPHVLDCPTYVSWMAVDMVYLVDMNISRQLYSEEMNAPGVSLSEAMTYAGIAGATAMGIMSLTRHTLPPPMDFAIYFISSFVAYGIVHYMDTGDPFWDA